jgi:hypothetical protein
MSDPEFFRQRMQITRPFNGNRVSYFRHLVTSHENSLHVGCADWPIFNINHNLHASLLEAAPTLEGFDPAADTIAEMSKHPVFKDAVFHTILPTDKSYQLVLVPEVIEHVVNPGVELRRMLNCVAVGGLLLVTAPNAFASSHMRNVSTSADGKHIETVHPDHKYWFSPYTLKYLVTSSLGDTIVIENVSLLEGDTMVCVVARRVQ